jgi:hypothetical protein
LIALRTGVPERATDGLKGRLPMEEPFTMAAKKAKKSTKKKGRKTAKKKR